MALPKLSTGALNIYADPLLGSATSPTTSPAASSKPEDSDPNYTLNYEEPEKVAQIGKGSRELGRQKCEILTAFSTVFVRIGLFLIVSPLIVFIVTLLVSEEYSSGVGWALLMFLISFFMLVPFGFLFLIVADFVAFRARRCGGGVRGSAHRD